MFTFGVLLIAAAVVLFNMTGPAEPAHAAEPETRAISTVQPVESDMHEFMEYIFEPSYKRLKVNMAAAEKTKTIWKAIKSDSLILAESSNLLALRPSKENRADWIGHTAAVREAGGQLYAAAKKKDADLAAGAYRKMLTRCNDCHKQFADGEHQLKP
jgi:hypothetical protein